MQRLRYSMYFAWMPLMACATTQSTSAPGSANDAANPLLVALWSTPYGAPPFELIKVEHYAPAFDVAMQQHRAEIDAIVHNPEPPTFDNTLLALEKSGDLLWRVGLVFDNLTESTTSEALQAVEQVYAPRRAAHADAVNLNRALFDRVAALYAKKAELSLNTEQTKLLDDTYRNFVKSGVQLDEAKKPRLMEINARLATLYTDFGNHLRQASAEYMMLLSKEEDLAGLPEAVRQAAASTATEAGHAGAFGFTLMRSSFTPYLQYAQNRERRRELYTAYTSHGRHNDQNDNQALVKEIVSLRAERAAMLGYPNHAALQIADNVAKTPEAVEALLRQLWQGALTQAKADRDALTELLRKDVGPSAKLEPWDWWYYAEKVRKARYDLNADDLKPYFQVDAVRQGAFDTASRLFGITFTEVTNKVPRYHPDVKAFEVNDKDGSYVGLLYVDYHPRPSKRSGAWAELFRLQSGIEPKSRPIVVNVGNFPAPTKDGPALLGWDEVETLFHEFGHALHGLLSNVTYPSLAAMSVKRDFVEFPSQLLENWASAPEVLRGYARHYKTGEPIPDALIEKLSRSAQFNQGFALTELCAAAMLDLAWHKLDQKAAAAVTDVPAFEAAAMQAIGLIPEISPRYHSAYFQHIFTGDSYSAGYYAYIWASVLEADAFAAFEQSGDIFNPKLAQRLRQYVLGAGSSDEEMRLYEAFRGQPPQVSALLHKLGIAL